MISLFDGGCFLVYRHIYQLHFSSSYSEYQELKAEAMAAWSALHDLRDFINYFDWEWLSSRFNNGQCFWSSSGISLLSLVHHR